MWHHEKRPSVRIKRVLSGEVRMEDEEPGIRSACQLEIYKGAKTILAMKTKDERRRAINRLPALIRPYVEKEVTRLWRDGK